MIASQMPSRAPKASAFAPPCGPVTGLADLFDGHPLEFHEAGAAIFWDGDIATHVYRLEEGMVRLVRILADGRRIITAFLHAGDLLGVSHAERQQCTAESVNGVTVRRLCVRRFREATDQNPILRPQLVELLCKEIALGNDRMVLLGRKNAEERVCSLLRRLSTRTDRGAAPGDIHVPMSRLDMADFLGLTIETVSRTMSTLFQRGIIVQVGRHAVTLRKPSALASLAGDEDEGDAVGSIAPAKGTNAWRH